MTAIEYTTNANVVLDDRVVPKGQTIFIEHNDGRGGKFWFNVFDSSGQKIGRVHVDKYYNFKNLLINQPQR
jgi:hypothetical protein